MDTTWIPMFESHEMLLIMDKKKKNLSEIWIKGEKMKVKVQ